MAEEVINEAVDTNVADPILETLADESDDSPIRADSPKTEETKSEEESTDDSEDKEVAETEEESTEAQAEEETESTDEQEQPMDAKELARQAYRQRQKEREERQARVQEAQQEHLEAAQDEQDLALRQLQIDAYTNKVDNNANRLQNGYDKAVNELEIFRDPTPEVKAVLDDALDEFESRFVQFDNLGNPVQVGGDIYQFLSNKADRISKLVQVGARNEKAGVAKQNSAVTPPPASSPKKPKADPILDILSAD